MCCLISFFLALLYLSFWLFICHQVVDEYHVADVYALSPSPHSFSMRLDDCVFPYHVCVSSFSHSLSKFRFCQHGFSNFISVFFFSLLHLDSVIAYCFIITLHLVSVCVGILKHFSVVTVIGIIIYSRASKPPRTNFFCSSSFYLHLHRFRMKALALFDKSVARSSLFPRNECACTHVQAWSCCTLSQK